ncbi:MAG: DUF2695 domain-containing protein [Candidatus Dormibacteraeota bacterium]|nr:DUF2695 domain-containing protein [Candidatus Dormibacteraeota bacterium]
MRSRQCRPTNSRASAEERLITPGHPRWDEFLERLTGPRALDVRNGGWSCTGSTAKRHSRRILLAMGLSPAAVAANLAFFERHGGYCDCEVWMNVESSLARRPPEEGPRGGEAR